MFTTLLFLVACFDEVPGQTSAPTWSSVYGSCPEVGAVTAVSADDLGEPVSVFVEVQVAAGWVPLSAGADLSSPSAYRTEDGGLVIACPQSAFGWHVAWGAL